MVKHIIRAHQKLFVDPYLTDSTEIEAIIHQMMHGKPHHKSIKLYQYFLDPFSFLEEGTSRTKITTQTKSTNRRLTG